MARQRKTHSTILAAEFNLTKLPIPETNCPIGKEVCDKVLCAWSSKDYTTCVHTKEYTDSVPITALAQIKNLNLSDVKEEIHLAHKKVKTVAYFHKLMDMLPHSPPVYHPDTKTLLSQMNGITKLYFLNKDINTLPRVLMLDPKLKPWKAIGLRKSKFKQLKKETGAIPCKQERRH